MDITFESVTSMDSSLFLDVNRILEKSFIPDERREYTPSLFLHSKFKLQAMMFEDNCVGMLSFWEFRDYIFIEHIAIDDEYRNKGLGGKVLKNFFSAYSSYLILMEAELPVTDFAKRRLDFYVRIGMQKNVYDYMQPAYSVIKSPVPMIIVSYPHKLSELEFEKIKKEIYVEVYAVKEC